MKCQHTPARLAENELERLGEIDYLCHEFETQWRQGSAPAIERYLDRCRIAAAEELLVELLHIELAYCRLSGETPTAEQYVSRFPDHADAIRSVFDRPTTDQEPSNDCGTTSREQGSEDNRTHTFELQPKNTTPSGQADTTTRPSQQTSAETPPGYFSNYELLEEIARGGMGIVYRAMDVKLNRIVALKMILDSQLASEASVSRFYAEAESAGRLDHPNIIPVYDVGEHCGQRYYTMGFVEGQSLASRLVDGPLPPEEAAQIIKTIAQAVQYAHDRGVIHRDLKPANVMVDKNRQPRVTDFGLAKRIDLDSDLTKTGQVMGTPSYMPPEQAQGDLEKIGPRSDVYSLGAMLYALLCGRPPFQAATALATVQQVLYDQPAPPQHINPAIDRDLETICLKCLEKDPQRRPQTAAELAEQLDRFLEGRPIQYRRAGRVELTLRWCARNPALAAAAGVAASALLAVAIVSSAFAVQQNRAAKQLRQEKENTLVALEGANKATGTARRERDRAVESERQARRLMAEIFLNGGLSRCEEGDVDRGLLWFARGLNVMQEPRDHAPETGRSPQHALRANLAAWSTRLHLLRNYWSRPGIRLVDFSPNGNSVLTIGYGESSTARLWDVETGKQIGQGFGQGVWDAEFSPDGKWVLTACADKSARLWDAATGKPVGLSISHQDGLRAVGFSPDGNTVLTISGAVVRLWDIKSAEPIGETLEHNRHVGAAQFSPDGKRVATAVEGEIRLWNAITGELIGQPMQHADHVMQLAFSPNGRTLVSSSNDDAAWLWNVSTGKPVGRPMQHQATIRSISFSPDGNQIVTASDDGTAQRWHAGSGEPIGNPLQHDDGVVTVAFSPDGAMIVTGSIDKTAQLWDAQTSEPLGPALRHPGPVKKVAFCPSGQSIATSSSRFGRSEDAVRLWEIASGTPLVHSLPHESNSIVHDVAYSPDGKSALTCSKTAHLWDTATGNARGRPIVHQQTRCVAFSPNGATILTGGNDKTARLWDAETQEAIGRPMRHEEPVQSIAFSADGKTLLTISGTVIRLWDAETGEPIGKPMRHGKAVWDATFSPDGKTVLSGGEDKTARLWRARTGKAILTLPHDQPVATVAFSPDGKTCLTGSGRLYVLWSGEARLWNSSNGEPLHSPLRHKALVRDVAFSPDGRTVATASDDHTARLWDAATGQPLGPPLQHDSGVRKAVFSHNGKMLLTGSVDGTARLWGVATSKPIGPTLAHDGSVTSISFSPDDEMILTGARDETARLWLTPLPLQGDAEQIQRWMQLVTGLELDDAGAFRFLDADQWTMVREKLRANGGLPNAR